MIKTVLLDDGGVMNNNSKRGHQWRKLVGEFFIPRYGGNTEDWAEANLLALQKIIGDIDQLYEQGMTEIYEQYYHKQDLLWITTMFDQLKIERPFDGDEDQLVKLARDATAWITPRVESSYPGMIDIIHQLGSMYELFTASNETSHELKGYLTGMGVVHLFSKYFGPDLLNAFKTSSYYYEQIIEQTGINPSEAVVIDDKLKNLKFARQAGFHTIHSGLEGAEPADDQDQFPYYTDPQLLEEILINIDQS